MTDIRLRNASSTDANPTQEGLVTSQSPIHQRLRYIDGLRALAALTVIVNHACQQIWWLVTPQGWMGKVYLWLCQGRYAVVAFIVLSGFCLMRPVALSGSLRGGAKEFYRGRALRILPAYWAAMLGTLLLIGTLIGHKHNTMFDLSLPVTIRGLLCHFFLINNFANNGAGHMPMGAFGNTEINSVYWTIALEWQIYFWFPLLVWAWKRVSMYLILTVGGVCIMCLHYLFLNQTWIRLNLSGANIYFYFYFLLGVMAASLVLSEKRMRFVNQRLFGLLAGCLLLGYPLMYAIMLKTMNEEASVIYRMELYTALMMTAILVSGALGGFRLLSWQPLVAVGTYSYSIYLLHLPLLALLTDYIILPLRGHISRNLEFGLLLLLGFPLILICSKRFASVFENKKQLIRYWNHGKRLLERH